VDFQSSFERPFLSQGCQEALDLDEEIRKAKEEIAGLPDEEQIDQEAQVSKPR